MIVDCFTFFDEFDLLELRLRILGGVVDRFVLCEAPFTFRGDPKPLHFASAPPERFARWRERITVLAYPGPADENPWQNEWGQRDYLATGLTGCAISSSSATATKFPIRASRRSGRATAAS